MSDRKARLAALAARAGRTIPPTTEKEDDEGHPVMAEAEDAITAAHDPMEDSSSTMQPTTTALLRFRNYTPSSNLLAVKDDDAEPASKRTKTDDDSNKKSALQEALQAAQQDIATTTATTATTTTTTTIVATPSSQKKVNWDLKRDIQPKLDKLEKRTQRAIVELLKQKIEQQAAGVESLD